MRTHLIAVTESVDTFRVLMAEAAARDLRVGWLELRPPAGDPILESALALGAAKGAAVGGGRSLSLKSLRGEPVLRDLAREHFVGCQLVLVWRPVADAPPSVVRLPRLGWESGAWRLDLGEEGVLDLSTGEFLDRLRRPTLSRRSARR